MRGKGREKLLLSTDLALSLGEGSGAGGGDGIDLEQRDTAVRFQDQSNDVTLPFEESVSLDPSQNVMNPKMMKSDVPTDTKRTGAEMEMFQFFLRSFSAFDVMSLFIQNHELKREKLLNWIVTGA